MPWPGHTCAGEAATAYGERLADLQQHNCNVYGAVGILTEGRSSP